MKVTLIVIGKTSASWIRTGIDEYVNRLRRYIPFEIKELPDLKSTRGLSEAQQKQREGEKLLAEVSVSDHVVLLDERGRMFTSMEFADWINKRAVSGSKNLVLMVGGPYGFSEAVYTRADEKISLSKMTFSHEMVRLFASEQIYRAMTILRGEPYHHE